MLSKNKYDIALSFAGDDRGYVEQVADALKSNGIKVFYDRYERVALWGKDLYSHLDSVYREQAKLCLIFISRSYALKVWTNHERASIQARALEENHEYVLPVRFDNTKIPGLRPTISYIDLDDVSPSELAELAIEKLASLGPFPLFPDTPSALFEELDIDEEDGKNQREAWWVAHDFWSALGRLTEDERTVLCTAIIEGCPGELPESMHVSMDHLRRVLETPEETILHILAGIRSQNFVSTVRDGIEVLEHHPGELMADERDLTFSFWSKSEPDASNPTGVINAINRVMTSKYCQDCSLERMVGRDFSALSGDNPGEIGHDANPDYT
ncbi:toll/interleukin-1 receptor domain-containing protein [uncultured Micrococcus sp.]|uniref:toll/interleukin-1 receptor domain-containing protein n=1 Tax=uncultured Micrococcus sp. TaxID=114051 RepID=UPI0025E0BE70|nr:TIR domain-containing protein [uncultured Micrococcus sp.]